MRRLDHCNIVKLKYFFYSSGDKASCTSSRVLGSISADTRFLASQTGLAFAVGRCKVTLENLFEGVFGRQGVVSETMC